MKGVLLPSNVGSERNTRQNPVPVCFGLYLANCKEPPGKLGLSQNRDADIAQRAKFYSEPDVARIIMKNGVPKSRKALEIMASEGSGAKDGSSAVTQKLIDCLNFVIFIVHPQQINIRDKATGKIIAVIPR
jgi:hypothetical protein